MRLYLVQHGQAKSEEVDPQRGLTEQGVRDVRALAAFIKPLSLAVAAVWHSDKTRAIQTAGILVSSLAGEPDLLQRPGLAPNDPVGPVISQLAGLQDDLMVVGHLPFLAKLASSLVIGREAPAAVAFRQGSIVCLERTENAHFNVCWMLVPEILPEVADA